MMMRSYVVADDTGFAPNPFGHALTLACCKPRVRKASNVGDWVIGTHASKIGSDRLCYAGIVSEILDFDAYYRDARFSDKRPDNRPTGDAIYYREDDGTFRQLTKAAHGPLSIAHDTKVDRVLVCQRFWYFGNADVRVPEDLVGRVVKRGPGHRHVDQVAADGLKAFLANYPVGRLGVPVRNGECDGCTTGPDACSKGAPDRPVGH